ncbi:hypothetical protein BC829DRAFT_402975 [Chytridium lagenaria]|nr:hypothetical protein BC829DRAFT_402975 [Chytridium lagenaria]
MTHLWKATVKRWPSHCQFPYGAVQGCVGQMGRLNGIFWDEFDDKPWVIPEEEIRNRRDLRETRIFSVDPATARDLDDALSIEELEDGTFKVGVHIADVSHFVNAGNALDEEAYLRATTVYLVQKAIPMLPRLLCEELCSLNPGVDRLAFSVIFHLTATGQPVSPPWYGRTLIRSCAKLSYDHAQALIDDLPDEVIEENLPPFEVFSPHSLDQIRRDTRALHKLSLELRKGRFEGLWFAVDAVGHPVETGVYELKDSNRMIEEFMLLANMAVAAKIASAFPTTALLRRHAQPKPKPLRDFIDLASTLGYHIDGTSSKTLQQSFADHFGRKRCRSAPSTLYQTDATRSIFQHRDLDLEFWGHYALNVPVYTHFTSPIRRYCDLVVHRLLDCAITNTETHYVCDVVGQIAKRCNERKFSAKDAQDASQHVYLCVYLSLKGGDEGVFADALVYRVGDRWFDVIVEEFGVEKRVWVDDGVESGEILGCKMDKEEGCLRVYWKKDGEVEEVPKEGEIKVEELEFGEEEFPVLGTEGDSDENDDMEDATPKKKTDGEEDHKKRRRGRRPRKRRGADGAGGFEGFKVVRVRLVVDMSRSPPELNGQKGGRRMEGRTGRLCELPGIVETAD